MFLFNNINIIILAYYNNKHNNKQFIKKNFNNNNNNKTYSLYKIINKEFKYFLIKY